MTFLGHLHILYLFIFAGRVLRSYFVPNNLQWSPCRAAVQHSNRHDGWGVMYTPQPSWCIRLDILYDVGQCHVCGGLNGSAVLLLTWLLRTRVQDCEDNWLATNYGEATFTRYEQVSGMRLSFWVCEPTHWYALSLLDIRPDISWQFHAVVAILLRVVLTDTYAF